MNKTYNKAERQHLERVKSQPCSVCNAPAPSAAHHIKQDEPYLCVALCHSCHQDNHNGIHGRKAIWKVMKLDEYDALAITIKRLLEKGNPPLSAG